MSEDVSAHDIVKTDSPSTLEGDAAEEYEEHVNAVKDLIDELREHAEDLAELESIRLGTPKDKLKMLKAVMIADIMFMTEADGDAKKRSKLVDTLSKFTEKDLMRKKPEDMIREKVKNALQQSLGDNYEVEMGGAVRLDDEMTEKLKDIDDAEELKDFLNENLGGNK